LDNLLVFNGILEFSFLQLWSAKIMQTNSSLHYTYFTFYLVWCIHECCWQFHLYMLVCKIEKCCFLLVFSAVASWLDIKLRLPNFTGSQGSEQLHGCIQAVGIRELMDKFLELISWRRGRRTLCNCCFSAKLNYLCCFKTFHMI